MADLDGAKHAAKLAKQARCTFGHSHAIRSGAKGICGLTLHALQTSALRRGIPKVDVWLSGLKSPLAVPEKSMEQRPPIGLDNFGLTTRQRPIYAHKPHQLQHPKAPEDGLIQIYMANEFFVSDATALKAFSSSSLHSKVSSFSPEVGRRNVLPVESVTGLRQDPQRRFRPRSHHWRT